MAPGLWRNANLATLAGGGLGIVERGALAVADGRIAWAGPEAALPADFRRLPAIDCRGELDPPRLRRLPHPPRLRRRPRARVRAASPRRELRGDRPRRRRHRLDGARHPRGRRRRRSLAGALPRVDALIAEGVAHGRDQVRLRPRPSRPSSACSASPARSAARARCACAPPFSARMRAPERGSTPTAISTRSASRRCAPPTPRGWSTRWTPSAKASPSRPAQVAPRLRPPRATSACR